MLFARLLPKEKIPFVPIPCIRLMIISQTTNRSTHGSTLRSAFIHVLSSFVIVKRISLSFHSFTTVPSMYGRVTTKRWAGMVLPLEVVTSTGFFRIP